VNSAISFMLSVKVLALFHLCNYIP